MTVVLSRPSAGIGLLARRRTNALQACWVPEHFETDAELVFREQRVGGKPTKPSRRHPLPRLSV